MVIIISQNKIIDFFYDFSPGHVPLNEIKKARNGFYDNNNYITVSRMNGEHQSINSHMIICGLCPNILSFQRNFKLIILGTFL